MSVMLTVVPSPRCTAAAPELTHKGNINYQTIAVGDKEICGFNITLLAGVIACCRHLVVDTNRTYFESARIYPCDDCDRE